MTGRAESACSLVNVIDCNAVVASVGTVEEFTRRVDVHIGGVVGALRNRREA